MAPALTASAGMLARRQLTRVASASSTTTPSSAMLVACRAMAQQRGYATPNGPPPQNFRTSKRVEWSWDRESTLDRMGKFFLMTEMARGMYVLLEQFFRAPYVTIFTSLSRGTQRLTCVFGAPRTASLTLDMQIHHLLPFREGTSSGPPIPSNLDMAYARIMYDNILTSRCLGSHLSSIPWRTRPPTIPLG
jgi:NADH dehydrogenase (ubiquinone) Fe-S protein 8